MAGDLGAVVAATAAVRGLRAGTAVLVDGRHLVTARHLLAARQGSGWSPAVPSVDLVFPGVPDGKATATPMDLPLVGDMDVAVLDLGESPPDWLPQPVRVWAGQRLPERVRLTGFPGAERELKGVWREFEVSGPTASGSVQLDWEKDTGALPGHSGGPVVDRESAVLVGILAEGSVRGRFDRFVPVYVIARCWPDLPRPWLFAGSGDARAHADRRARGQRARARSGDLFRGRANVLYRIDEWLTAPATSGRPLVVTGQPGAGKSAVLARAALDAERDRTVPGVFFHARGATEEQLLDAVAAYNGLSTPAGLDGLLDDLLRQEPDATVALVVDALDEGADRRVIARTLTELAIIPWLRIVVGTRPMAAADRYARGLLPDLEVTSADAENLVDLDADPYRDPEGLRAFAAALLQQEGTALPGPVGGAWERYRTEDGLRDSLAALIAHRGGVQLPGRRPDRRGTGYAGQHTRPSGTRVRPGRSARHHR